MGGVNSMPCSRFSLGELLDWSSEAHGVYWASYVLTGRKAEEEDINHRAQEPLQIQQQSLAVYYP